MPLLGILDALPRGRIRLRMLSILVFLILSAPCFSLYARTLSPLEKKSGAGFFEPFETQFN